MSILASPIPTAVKSAVSGGETPLYLGWFLLLAKPIERGILSASLRPMKMNRPIYASLAQKTAWFLLNNILTLGFYPNGSIVICCENAALLIDRGKIV